ncbi:MerR family transcriptional regulator [Clostridium sp. YIM B02505]|uniref:MerR family transcriptional regulator n=1 Tax=Clostridium yunnanense TaxID=2800325 RepID=A0ABS1ESH0_9CLOT|nr:MerR family transcriptional regulator [Clostridium yunnanense]MBK1812316.1 MerR family transcriptional regulator [Clostridium yunnanense]
MEEMYTIREVCDRYGVTTRTLRFYEEKGMLRSVQEKARMPREYSKHEAEKIGHILFLKELGFNISEICEFLNDKYDLKSAIQARQALIQAQIELKNIQLRRLQNTMKLINEGKDIFSFHGDINDEKKLMKERALEFAKSFIEKDWDSMSNFFSPTAKDFLSLDIIRKLRETISDEIGNFKNIVHTLQFDYDISLYLEFENCGAVMKIVFSGPYIVGFTIDEIDIDIINVFFARNSNVFKYEQF